MSIALLHQRIWSAKAVCPQKLTKVKCVATARYAIARTTMQIEIGAQEREAIRHGGWDRRGLVEAEYLSATVATKMDVLRVLAFRRGGKAEHAVGVGVLVRQAAFDQPVKDAIKRHAIQCRLSKRLLDLVVTQRSRR